MWKSQLDHPHDQPVSAPLCNSTVPDKLLQHLIPMAPIASLTEPISRFARNLAHALIGLASTSITSDPHSIYCSSSSSPSSTPCSTSNVRYRRQTRFPHQILSISATYGGLDSSPAPGTVVGIVFAVVGGVVIAFWITYFIIGLRRPKEEEIVVVEDSVSDVAPPRRRASAASRPRSRRMEIVEVEESRRRPSSSRHRHPEEDEIIVEESAVSGTQYSDDVVEVIEEPESSVATSPPRRHSSRRASGGYRRGDPYRYGRR